MCVFGSHTFVSISWMRKKKASVSIIPLDAGLRLDGLPALDLWDLIVSVEETRLRQQRDPCDPLSLTEIKDLQGRLTR